MEPIVYMCREQVNSSNADAVTNELIQLIKEKRDIIIDMKNTTYISSVAFRTFTIAQKALKACSNCDITFINLNDYIRKTFNIVGMSTVFKIE